ncbi:MAG: nucleoside deaminase [Planctomycetes bacterium]|nr:nucleoside deaminase [Planctomycetota bacterium]
MRRCLELASEAATHGEVPVGAVVVLDGIVIGSGRNRSVELRNPLAHAEMEALEQAFQTTGDARLPGAELYCSLEPCFMCTGALLHARVARVVFGAHDPKFGACGSLAELPTDARLNHRCEIVSGVMGDESARVLREFFRRLR